VASGGVKKSGERLGSSAALMRGKAQVQFHDTILQV
jgi:hypothetical protein